MKKRKLTLAIDFDDTIVNSKWPDIGELKPFAKEVINELYNDYNCDIIIWTCRENKELQDVYEFLNKNDIKYTTINENTPAIIKCWSNLNCRKVFADLYIDDRGIYTPNNINWIDIKEHVLMFKMGHYREFI